MNNVEIKTITKMVGRKQVASLIMKVLVQGELAKLCSGISQNLFFLMPISKQIYSIVIKKPNFTPYIFYTAE